MMDDLISRQAAIDAILAVTGNSSVRELYEHVQEHGLSEMWSGGVSAAIDIIIAVPSAQPKRKAGHWGFQGDQMFMCTCCCYLASQEQLESWRVKKTDSAFPLFCPNCGARMKNYEGRE